MIVVDKPNCNTSACSRRDRRGKNVRLWTHDVKNNTTLWWDDKRCPILGITINLSYSATPSKWFSKCPISSKCSKLSYTSSYRYVKLFSSLSKSCLLESIHPHQNRAYLQCLGIHNFHLIACPLHVKWTDTLVPKIVVRNFLLEKNVPE